VASLSFRLGDAAAVARVSGTSIGKAREAVATGTTIQASPDLDAAMRQGAVSLDQAAEIARAEEGAPGSARTLVKVAQDKAFHVLKDKVFRVLKDKARKVKLEAEQHRDPHGPASTSNLEPRCWPCHQAKTARDRRAGKLRLPDQQSIRSARQNLGNGNRQVRSGSIRERSRQVWILQKPLVPQQYGLAVVEAVTLVDYSHVIASATLDYVVTSAALYPISTTTRL
jgi:hypothetical protein